jgi:hypothetical protein
MSIRTAAVIGIIALLVSGCLRTSYGPRSLGHLGGYSERQLAPDIWEVTGRTNGHSHGGYAGHMAFYRAAELARQAGFSFMQILDSNDRVNPLAGGTAAGGSVIMWSGGYGGETAWVRVRGVNDASARPVGCEMKDNACPTVPVAQVMSDLAPRLHINASP